MKKSGMYALFSVGFLILFGIAGYRLIEGWSIGESLYMTMITITTTGYQEVRPLSVEGRIFTMFLLAGGVGTLAFVTHMLANEIMSIDRVLLRRQKMLKKIQKLKAHTIVCGFGRIGKIVCRELKQAGIQFVVIDESMDNFQNVPDDYLWLVGDATSDTLLLEAGIERASVMASMVDRDSDALYLTLAAHSLNPKLKITARVSNESAKLKLIRAGADQVIQPLLLSGQKIAQMIRGEAEGEEALESLADIRPQTLYIKENSAFIDMDKEEFEEKSQMSLLAVASENGEITFRENFNGKIKYGDRVIALPASSKAKPHLKLVA